MKPTLDYPRKVTCIFVSVLFIVEGPDGQEFHDGELLYTEIRHRTILLRLAMYP